jgi:hypothetical protein
MINRLIVVYQVQFLIIRSPSHPLLDCSRDSPVVQRWAMGWMIGVRFPAGAGNFSIHRVETGSGPHPASYPMRTRGSFPGGKAAGGEADHSPPSSAEVKNAWSYTSTPPNEPSWRGAHLKESTGTTLPLHLSSLDPHVEGAVFPFSCG